MGVRGLQSFVRQYSNPKTMNDLLHPDNSRLRIGIDISYYMYKWQGDVERILAFLRRLESNKHRILLGFDGRAEEGKQWEAQRRRQAREDELKSAHDLQAVLDSGAELTEDQRKHLESKIAEHQRRGWSITRDVRTGTKRRFYEEKICMVKAKSEADGMLAAMNNVGTLDIVISGDMDLLAMGAKCLWTPIEDGLSFREYIREDILQELGLGDWQFRSMCAMCFTEASAEQNIFDIRQAYQAMRLWRNLETIKKRHPEWLTTWPDAEHIFYRSVDKVEGWVREDQIPIYRAFVNGEPMPYTD